MVEKQKKWLFLATPSQGQLGLLKCLGFTTRNHVVEEHLLTEEMFIVYCQVKGGDY